MVEQYNFLCEERVLAVYSDCWSNDGDVIVNGVPRLKQLDRVRGRLDLWRYGVDHKIQICRFDEARLREHAVLICRMLLALPKSNLASDPSLRVGECTRRQDGTTWTQNINVVRLLLALGEALSEVLDPSHQRDLLEQTTAEHVNAKNEHDAYIELAWLESVMLNRNRISDAAKQFANPPVAYG